MKNTRTNDIYDNLISDLRSAILNNAVSLVKLIDVYAFLLGECDLPVHTAVTDNRCDAYMVAFSAALEKVQESSGILNDDGLDYAENLLASMGVQKKSL